jgi:radical SAM superfamily enzyme YgiQ (UPF0313 family)
MKILLVEPKRTNEDETTLETHYTYPHLGLLSIASNLEDKGNKVDYFSTNSYKNPIATLKKLLKKQYDFAGISSITATLDYQLRVAGVIKRYSKNTKIIFGGIHPWLFPEELLKDKNVDFVIRGFGELPFLKLTNGEKFEKIPGLCYKISSKKIIKEPYIPTNKELQEIRSILLYSKYDKVYNKSKTFRNTRHLFTSFGCPFNCNFCSVPKLFNGEMYFKNINSVVNEIKELSKKTTRIMFVDPDLNINKKHFMELFTSILKEKKKKGINKDIKFIIQARPDCFDYEMLTLAKKSNIIALIGIESISKKIRNIDLNKGGKIAKMSKKQIIKEINNLKKYLKTYLYFILATPQTKEKDLLENLKYIKTLKRGWYEINIHVTPFPETNYYNKYKDTNLIVWNKLKNNSHTKMIPIELKCQDKLVETDIEKASKRAQEIHQRNKKLSFSNLFIKELMKEFNLS